MSLTLFLQMQFPLRSLHVSMPILRCVFGRLGAANRGKTSVHDLLRTIADLSRRTQEGLTNNSQRLRMHPKICRLTSKARLLCEGLAELDAYCYHLRIQLRSMQNTVNYYELDFSALAAK